MANSKFTVTFVDGNKSGEAVHVHIENSNQRVKGPFIETFQRGPRNAPGQIPILNDSDPSSFDYLSAEDAAQFFAHYFEMDYAANRFSVTVSGDTVTVTSLIDGVIFIRPTISASVGSIVITNQDDADIAATRINISTVELLASAANNCDEFKIRITTDQNFDSYSVNTSTTALNANVFEVDLLRDVNYFFRVTKTVAGGNDAWKRYPNLGSLKIPRLLAENFNVQATSSIESGTVRISPTFISILKYEYSIDGGTNWQPTGVFTGLADGNYTVLIRDHIDGQLLGCQTSVDFTVETVSTREPFISISKANSLYFAKQEDTDGVVTFANDNNTFSLSNKGTINYCNEALFENKDETRIQFKSSFDNITVFLRDEDGGSTQLTVNQRTDNLQRFKSMDAIMDHYMEGKSIIYFNSGNVYDQAGAVIDTYNLGGNLPDFAIVGESVELPTYGVLEIDDIVYLDSINKRAIVVNVDFAGTLPTSVIVKSLYNILDYNIFDFDIIWAGKSEGHYDVLINFDDSEFESEVYLSENIYLKDEHPGTVHVRAFNTTNRDIFYKYDIYPTIRVPVEYTGTLIRDNISNNITDDSVEVIESELNTGTIFQFQEMTREALVKLSIFLSCEFVFIDGIGYAKSDSLAFENVDGTNLQIMSAQMLKTEINYNNLIDLNTGVDFGAEEVNLPNFLTQNTNFIKY